ncbi:unnamed protein product [Nippostrongylus brasiliensis]|uniref:Uncharacterized protein n=1 Tax=Nippostrongylus brasiliensis TaxID=27835 RepID=A0A0N4XTW8_NIPBR|nr:unnamed protein product [Nippostrongylus brasiliensis]
MWGVFTKKCVIEITYLFVVVVVVTRVPDVEVELSTDDIDSWIVLDDSDDWEELGQPEPLDVDLCLPSSSVVVDDNDVEMEDAVF